MEENEIYLRMSIKERWSFQELSRQINSAYFEKFVLSQKPDKLMKTEQEILRTTQRGLAIPSDDINRHIKDEYILEFLELSKTFSERELRRTILNNLRDFFLEFGKNLSFVGEDSINLGHFSH